MSIYTSTSRNKDKDIQLVNELVSRFDLLKAQRDESESIRREEVFDLVCPYRRRGYKKNARWDTTATSASDKLASLLHNLITPFGSRWHGLIAPDKRSGSFAYFSEAKILREGCERLVDELFAQREVSESGFNLCLKDFYTEVVLFGMGCFYITARKGGGLRYISVPVSSIVCSTNHENVIDTVFEEFTLKAEDVAKKWGMEALSDEMKADLNSSDPKTYEFFQAVFPDKEDEYQGYQQVVVCKKENRLMSKGYHRVMPYIIGRYEASNDTPFGYSPTYKALPAIRRLNTLSRASSIYSDQSIQPPKLLTEEARGKGFSVKANSMNYGFLDRRTGAPLIQTLENRNDPRPAHTEIQRLELQIRETYMLDLFQLLADRASRSATESMEKTREKGVFISAIVGGLQAEFVGAMVKREIDVLLHSQGANRGELKGVRISYTSPLYKYQKAEIASSNMQALRAIAEAANITGDPTLLAMVKTYEFGEETLRDLGMSERLISSEEDTNKKIEGQRQQAEEAQMKQLAIEQSIKTGGEIAESRVKEQG
ncbi:MAG: phage tail protein [Candidatus Liberibacter europaeus]|uniref:Phage tail protein n=1 Tax=Candidatus Liberibacter europaeus TaxID=744859 RepID=A0A2T4VWN0_9HYPH|nr:MAG: phage tail protein [Candidatus Liberibacter europaeus]